MTINGEGPRSRSVTLTRGSCIGQRLLERCGATSETYEPSPDATHFCKMFPKRCKAMP